MSGNLKVLKLLGPRDSLGPAVRETPIEWGSLFNLVLSSFGSFNIVDREGIYPLRMDLQKDLNLKS